MNGVQELAMAAGLAWASGIRLYAVLFVTGLLGYLDIITLPPDLQILAHPVVLVASGFMLFVEFFADKIPGLDSLWDGVHTFIRGPGGALLAAGVFGTDNPGLALAAAILGGTLATGTHLTKAGSRALVNTSPEPFSNWAASLSEDALVVFGLWLMSQHPLAFLVALALFIALMLWLLPKLWRGLRWLWRRMSGPPPGAPAAARE